MKLIKLLPILFLLCGSIAFAMPAAKLLRYYYSGQNGSGNAPPAPDYGLEMITTLAMPANLEMK